MLTTSTASKFDPGPFGYLPAFLRFQQDAEIRAMQYSLVGDNSNRHGRLFPKLAVAASSSAVDKTNHTRFSGSCSTSISDSPFLAPSEPSLGY